MRVGIYGSSAGDDRNMTYERVRAEATVNHCRVCYGLACLQVVYRGEEDGGIQQVTTVARPITRPYTGGVGGWLKYN